MFENPVFLRYSQEEEELEPHERKKLKKMKAVSDSEEEEEGEFFRLWISGRNPWQPHQ